MPTYFRVTSGHLMFTPRGRILWSLESLNQTKNWPGSKRSGLQRSLYFDWISINLFHFLVRYLIKSPNGTIFDKITTYVRSCAYMNFHVCNSDHEVVGVVVALQLLFENFDKLCLKVVYIVRLDLMQDGRTQ